MYYYKIIKIIFDLRYDNNKKHINISKYVL